MHRFFVPADQLPLISGTDAHHIKNVLRMQAGEELELLDGQGNIYRAKIEKISKDYVQCKITAKTTSNIAAQVKITLAQGLPKAKKMDLIIQKCTELGVWEIIPVTSERTIAKREKLARWQSIAKEAAKQCGSPYIPTVQNALPFSEMVKKAMAYELALLPWELETAISLKHILSSRQPKHILLLIGPEGGLSKQEAETAMASGFISVSLGPRILRTETAGMAALSMIHYAYHL